MKNPSVTSGTILLFLAFVFVRTTVADEVQILAADFQQQPHHKGGTKWSVSVTLKHNDSGWDHYADEWRVVGPDGQVFGNRVLLHPHIDEQPFTRSTSGVMVPEDISIVYIEAHDKPNGWMKNRVAVDLDKADNGRIQINRN